MANKLLIKNSLFSFLRAFLSLAFPLISFPYASRILEPDGIGRINFALSIVTIFTVIANLGITSYATRECAKFKTDKIRLSKFVKEILIINLISALVSYIFLFITINSIQKLYEYKSLLLIFSFHIIANVFFMDWFYYAIDNVKIIPLFSSLFQILSLIFLFTFVKTKEDLNNYAIFGIIPICGSAITNFIYSKKYINYRIKIKLNFKQHITYLFTFFGMSIVTNLYSIIDSSMLGFLSSDFEIGLYTAAIKINKIIIGLIVSFFTVLLPHLARFQSENSESKFIKLSQQSIKIIILLTIPLSIGLYILSKPLIILFCGTAYLDAIIVMKVMTPIVFFIGITNIIGTQILPAIQKEKKSLWSYLFGLGVNIFLNHMFIPKFGALGAAYATLFAEFSTMIIQTLLIRKYIINADLFINLLQTIFSSFVTFIFLFFSVKKTENIYMQLFIIPILSIIIYIICLILLKNSLILDIKKRIFDKLIFCRRIKDK